MPTRISWMTGRFHLFIFLSLVLLQFEIRSRMRLCCPRLGSGVNRSSWESALDQAIVIEGLSYAYGAKAALKDVSLSLGVGRFTALLGPNGAGKSTLFALMTGLFVPQSGRIEIFGRDIARDPLPALAQMGVVFQQRTLDLDLSVGQNMTYYAALQGLSRKRASRRIAAALARMGLEGREAEKAWTLNGGHRRRLEIARVLIHGPRFLLLDEPTAGLDLAARRDLVTHVHGLCREDGVTVFWATHLVEEIAPEDDVVILHGGKVRAAGALAAVLSAHGQPDAPALFSALTEGTA